MNTDINGAIEDAMREQQTVIIDTAKMFFLIGLQAAEVAAQVNREIDLQHAWELMMTSEDIGNIKRNRALFLQSIYKPGADEVQS